MPPMNTHTTSLILKEAHTHAGQSYPPGARIEVDAHSAQWLLSHGLASLEPKPAKTDLTPPPMQRKESQS